MLAVAERVREQEPAPTTEAARPARPHGVHTLQRAAGNRAVRRALQRSARRSGRLDPAEAEAERNAAAVLGSGGVAAAPRRCACGGLVLGGGECARCRAERLQRRAATGAVDAGEVASTPAVDRILDQPGRALDPGVRSSMEERLGSDFGAVRVHTGFDADAAARSVDADAFTVGSDVVFGEGKFAPHAAEGRGLIAHELTHVAQQAQGTPRLSRQQKGHDDETKPQFETRVRERAATRLTQNIGVLGEWSAYINTMEGFQLRAQLMSGSLMEHAIAAGGSARGRQRFETEVGTDNPAERAYEGSVLDIESTYRERSNNFMGLLASKTQGYWTTPNIAQRMQVLAGDRAAADLPESRWVGPDPRYHWYAAPIQRIQRHEEGGCQACHDINWAWQRTIDEFGTPLPNDDLLKDPRGPLGRVAMPSFGTPLSGDQLRLLSAWIQEQSGSAPSTLPSTAAQPTTLLSTAPVSTPAPAAANPFIPSGQLPAGLELPQPRTNLCGDLPDAEDSPRVPRLADWGPNSAIVEDVIGRIDAVLLPLGPRGYRVLGRQIFDQLWAVSPDNMQSVRDGIIARIAEKQQQYASLRSDIQAGDVPYEELCPIVDELLPTTNELVKYLVLQDVSAWQTRERVIQILELVLLALSILYPPSMVLTIPAGMALGLARASLGISQVRQGRQWTQGIGAGIYSQQQEAEAPTLASRGRTNIITGTLSFGLSAVSFARMVSEARATAQLLEALETGAVIRHAQYPGIALLARNGRLLLVTDTGEVLGYGMIANGQISWTYLEVPFNPFTSAPGTGGAGAGTGSSIVPYTGGGMAPSGTAPFGLLPSGPQPFGLLPAGPAPFGLLPSGATPFGLLPAGPTPYGLLGPGAPVVPPVPRGPLMLPPGPTPYGLLGPGPVGPVYGPPEPLVIVKIEGPQKGQFWYEGSRQFGRYGGSPTAPADQRYITMPLTDAQALGFRPAGTPPNFQITPRPAPGGGLAESLGAGRLTPHPITARTTRQPPAAGTTPSTELEAPDIDPSAAWAFPRTIAADISQMQGYNRLLDLGEKGILRPGNVSTGGVDAITAEVSGGKAKIFLNDFTSPGTPKAATKPTHTDWAGELADATGGNRLNFNDKAVEDAIRQAIKDKEVYTRTVRVETTGTSAEPKVTIGAPTKVSF